MNTAALAMLQDLARSRKLLKSGKDKGLSLRPLKRPASGGPRSKQRVRMQGLGHAEPQMVISEADTACKLLMRAEVKAKNPLKWMSAIEDYFRASAIATNVMFTAKVEKLSLPSHVTRDMDTVVTKSMEAIKKMAKSAVIKSLFKRGKK
jgi:hypothetical protein